MSEPLHLIQRKEGVWSLTADTSETLDHPEALLNVTTTDIFADVKTHSSWDGKESCNLSDAAFAILDILRCNFPRSTSGTTVWKAINGYNLGLVEWDKTKDICPIHKDFVYELWDTPRLFTTDVDEIMQLVRRYGPVKHALYFDQLSGKLPNDRILDTEVSMGYENGLLFTRTSGDWNVATVSIDQSVIDRRKKSGEQRVTAKRRKALKETARDHLLWAALSNLHMISSKWIKDLNEVLPFVTDIVSIYPDTANAILNQLMFVAYVTSPGKVRLRCKEHAVTLRGQLQDILKDSKTHPRPLSADKEPLVTAMLLTMWLLPGTKNLFPEMTEEWLKDSEDEEDTDCVSYRQARKFRKYVLKQEIADEQAVVSAVAEAEE